MKTVLLVDDLEQNRYLLRTILAAEGWRVIEAGTGKEALAAAHRQPPDLVISDILMPGMDGYTLCRTWKRDPELKDVPFVFCTATFTDDLDEKLALELGADDFIRQPVDPDDLIKRVRAVEKRPARGPSPAILQTADKHQASEETYSLVLARKLDHKVTEYRQSITELETSRSELDKRIKELTCLHTIGGLARDPNIGLETLCQETANEMASAVSTANPIAIRVHFDDHDYCSSEFTGSV